MQLDRLLSFNGSLNINQNGNFKTNQIKEKDVSIFDFDVSNNTDKKQNVNLDTIFKEDENELKVIDLQKIIEKYGIDEAKDEKDTDEENVDDIDIKDLSEEEIQSMTTEELIEMFRSDLSEILTAKKDSLFGSSLGDMNNINQNEIFFDLVSKMTDEQLDDFMNTYKEMYPKSMNDGVIDLFSFESLENGVMWGNYAVASGRISQDELDSTMERLKKYFPKLVPDSSLGAGSNAYLQWA